MSTNSVTNPNPTAPVIPAAPSQNGDDETAQAMFLLGYLGLLAQRYAYLEANGGSQSELNAILQQFNQFRSYYSVNGSTVTFSYDEGSKTVQLNDPTLLALVQTMPTDISKFNIFWTDTTNTPVIAILQWMSKDNFDLYNASPMTQAMAIVLELSAEATPVGSLSGVAGNFLDNTILFQNNFVVAQALSVFLGQDKAINASVFADALNISGASSDYQAFYQLFSANYQNWMENPPFSEEGLFRYEARYWPGYLSTPVKEQKINAVPLSSNSIFNNHSTDSADASKALKTQKTKETHV